MKSKIGAIELVEKILKGVVGKPKIVQEKVGAAPQVILVQFDDIISARLFITTHGRDRKEFPGYFDGFWYNFSQILADREEFYREYRHLFKIKYAILETIEVKADQVVVRKNDKKVFISDRHDLRLICHAPYKDQLE